MRRAAFVPAVVTLVAACAPAAPVTEDVRITIPRGATLRAVADTLAGHGLIRSPRWFRIYTGLRGDERSIRAGVYDIPGGLSTAAVVERLVSGPLATQRLIVYEGLMLEEVAEGVEAQIGIPADSFLVAARDSTLRARLDVPAPTLEGYLYPSTYHVRIGATARELVAQMVEEFASRWRPEWHARLDSLGMSRWEAVILASIIEGEVRHDRDRTFVSSVYHNRLRAGWRLQADPTVIYALGRRRRLYEKDYLTRSPYNTYLIDGLPPGPIGQPSAASIRAALYPARTDFFFFVARADGQHVFSRTLREHTRAIAEIRSPRNGG